MTQSPATIGCAFHPVNHWRILEALRQRFGAGDDAINAACATWITGGFGAVESLVRRHGRGPFAFGAQPTMADTYLVPQIGSARRFKVDLAHWPTLMEIDQACASLNAFKRAAPAAQADAS